jgi:hypothetical protein
MTLTIAGSRQHGKWRKGRRLWAQARRGGKRNEFGRADLGVWKNDAVPLFTSCEQNRTHGVGPAQGITSQTRFLITRHHFAIRGNAECCCQLAEASLVAMERCRMQSKLWGGWSCKKSMWQLHLPQHIVCTGDLMSCIQS